MRAMRRYLAGNGENPLSEVANHTLLLLAARAMAVLGPAVASLLFYEVWLGIKEQRAELGALKETVAAQSQQMALRGALNAQRLEEHERRLGLLEQPRR